MKTTVIYMAKNKLHCMFGVYVGFFFFFGGGGGGGSCWGRGHGLEHDL